MQELFATADADDSGAIDRDEFVRVAEKARAGGGGVGAVVEKQSEQMFQMKKDNMLHSISTEELVALTAFINAKLEGDKALAYLLPIRRPEDLFTVVADGVLLAKLINVAVPDTVDERVLNLRP